MSGDPPTSAQNPKTNNFQSQSDLNQKSVYVLIYDLNPRVALKVFVLLQRQFAIQWKWILISIFSARIIKDSFKKCSRLGIDCLRLVLSKYCLDTTLRVLSFRKKIIFNPILSRIFSKIVLNQKSIPYTLTK